MLTYKIVRCGILETTVFTLTKDSWPFLIEVVFWLKNVLYRKDILKKKTGR